MSLAAAYTRSMTRSASFDPRRLDVAAFAAAGGTLSGEWPLSDFARLPEAPDEARSSVADPVRWQADGRMARLVGVGLQPALHLRAQAKLVLRCQRCLGPLSAIVQAERHIGFVDGEDAAAALDAESDDDVLARVPALDLRELVEDELLLALPLVPRHDVCPDPLPLRDPEDAALSDAGNPFAALAALRRGGPVN